MKIEKLKAGDTVLLRSDLEVSKTYDLITYLDDMLEPNSIATITFVESDCNVHFKECVHGYDYSSEMIQCKVDLMEPMSIDDFIKLNKSHNCMVRNIYWDDLDDLCKKLKISNRIKKTSDRIPWVFLVYSFATTDIIGSVEYPIIDYKDIIQADKQKENNTKRRIIQK